VFKNRALKKILGGREEVTGDWNKSQHKGLGNLYSSSNIIWLTKSRMMRLEWGGGHTQEEEERNIYRILVGKPKGKRPPVDLGIDEKIIFNWILKK
jgi:hypothetical protein